MSYWVKMTSEEAMLDNEYGQMRGEFLDRRVIDIIDSEAMPIEEGYWFRPATEQEIAFYNAAVFGIWDDSLTL